jgi:hypothetical protein
MKTVIRLGFLASLSLIIFSCNKQVDTTGTVTTTAPTTAAQITASIFPFTNQPSATVLGEAKSVFHAGDVVAIYVPYGVANDQIVTAQLILENASTNELLGTFDLLPSTDPSGEQLEVPTDLINSLFMFAKFTIDDSYTGKTVNITTSMIGYKTISQEKLENGFSVQP